MDYLSLLMTKAWTYSNHKVLKYNYSNNKWILKDFTYITIL